MERTATQVLSGWGRFPRHACMACRPERRAGLIEALQSTDYATVIARGLGRSYGDPAVNEGGGVILCERLNRMLAFDPATGVLECEAGVSIEEILDTFIPRGFFPPVTPGTKFVTVGGAIANDVHGKNHHRDGTFGMFVRELTLLTPGGETLVCSPDERSEVFWATVGGIGLTGIILTAKVQLRPIETSYIRVDYIQSRNIHETLAKFAESDDQYTYSVAWVDCLASGANLGRSVLMRGNHLPASELPDRGHEPLAVSRPLKKTAPFDFPGFALNPLSIRAFNEVFYRGHPTRQGKIVDYDSYFYPLDAVLHWNRIYGRRGFTQYQISLPPDESEALVHVLERLSASSRASFLAVLKCFGPANPGMLSHPFEGYTLTLDVPMKTGLVAFLQDLDAYVLAHGGRLYLAKDATTRPETIHAMYPRLDAFRAVKAQLDPKGRLSSSMARRLRIVE